MSPEKQRMAIAEACGWTLPINQNYYALPLHIQGHAGKKDGINLGQWTELPDFCNDLNAMHEAVKTINSSWTKYGDYITALRKIVAIENSISDNCTPPYCSEVDATAAQRAEAFLRTIGKWE